MKALLFGTTIGAPSTSAANFVPIHAQASTPTATETARLQVLPAAFTLQSFYVSVNNAPGTGKSYVFTVRKNQVDTAITITISDTNTSGTYTGAGVSFAAGDTISIGITPSGTPTAPTLIYWNLQTDSGGTHFAPIVGGAQATTSLSTSANSFSVLTGSSAATSWGATEANFEIIIPCAGTINNLYVIADAAAGAAKTWAVALMQNGLATTLSASFTGTTAKSGNDTTHSVSVVAGDTLSIQAAPTGTPTVSRICWGLKFSPTNPGESFFGFGNSNAPSATATQYEMPLGIGSNAYSGTESARQIIPGACTLKALYVTIGTAAGGATTRTFTVRLNSASTSLAAPFTGTSVTSNTTAQNVALNQTDLISLQAAETGTPAADTGGVHIGVLVFIPIYSTSLAAATLSFSGNTLTTSAFHKTLTGSLSFVGNVGNAIYKNVSAVLAPAAVLSRSIAKILTGTASFNGILTRTDKPVFTATSTFSGNTQPGSAYHKTLTAGQTFIGSNTKAILHGSSAMITFTGSITSKALGKLFHAGLAFNDLILNGGFEVTPPFIAATSTVSRWINGTAAGSTTDSSYGWGIINSGLTATANAQFDASTSHSGASSMMLSTLDTTGAITCGTYNGTNASGLPTLIPMSSSTSYTLTAWIKTNNVATNSAFIEIREWNNAFTNVQNTQTSKLSGTNGWTLISKTFTTSATTTSCGILLRNNVAGNIGQAWFDDIVLLPTAQTILSRQVQKTMTGSLSSIGAISKTAFRGFNAGLTFTGAFAATRASVYFKSLSAALGFVSSPIGTIARISSQSAIGSSNTNTVSANYPGTTASGDLLIAMAFAGATSSAPTVPGWTMLVSYNDANIGSTGAILYKLADGTEHTITASASGAGFMYLDVFEYTGNANPVVTDGTPAAQDNGGSSVTTYTTPAITTAQANDLVFSAMFVNAGISAPSWATSTAIGTNSHIFCGEYLPTSAQTNFSDTASWTTGGGAASLIGAFKAAPTGGIPKTVNRPFAAALGLAGTLKRNIATRLASVLAFLQYTFGSGTFGGGGTFGNPATDDLTKLVNATKVGSLSFTTVNAQSIVHTMPAGLTFIGSTIRRITHGLTTAALNFSGVLLASHQQFISFTAAVNFAGSIRRTTGHTIAASVSFTGTITKQLARIWLAALRFIGTTGKQSAHTVAAVLGLSGTLSPSKILHTAFTASLGFTGAITKAATYPIGGALSFVGSSIKTTSRGLIRATLSFGTATRNTFAHVQGKSGHVTATNITLTLPAAATAGNLIVVNFQIEAVGVTGISVTDNASTPNIYAVAKSETDFASNQYAGYQYYGVQVTGGATQIAISFTGSHFISAVVDEFSGGASSNAAVFDKSSSGIGSSSSSSAASFSPANTGELIVAGIYGGGAISGFSAGTNYTLGTNDSILSYSEYRLSGVASETAPASWTGASSDWAEVAGAYIPGSTQDTNLIKQTNKALSGVLSFTGSIARTIKAVMTAAVSFTGNIARRTIHQLTSAVSFVALTTIAASHSLFQVLTSSLGFSGTTTKQTRRLLVPATLSSAGVVTLSTLKVLSAVISPTASAFTRVLSKAMAAALTFTGSLPKLVARSIMTAAVSFTGNMSKSVSKSLIANVGPSGRLSRTAMHCMTSALSFSASVAHVFASSFTASLSFAGKVARRSRVRRTRPIFLEQNDSTTHLGQNNDTTTFSNNDDKELFM